MAYKYQPIKDEILVSDSEIEDDVDSVPDGVIDMVGRPVTTAIQIETELTTGEVESTDDNTVNSTYAIIKGEKQKQVIEQDNVLILGTVDAELPAGSTVIASGEMVEGSVEGTSVLVDPSVIENTDVSFNNSQEVILLVCIYC